MEYGKYFKIGRRAEARSELESCRLSPSKGSRGGIVFFKDFIASIVFSVVAVWGLLQRLYRRVIMVERKVLLHP